MDDGGITAYNQTVLHTNSYSADEIALLQSALLANFKLRTRVIIKKEGQWLIAIPVRQEVSLKAIVGRGEAQHMHDSMKYKIGM